jgi:sulfatase modifying factor 1
VTISARASWLAVAALGVVLACAGSKPSPTSASGSPADSASSAASAASSGCPAGAIAIPGGTYALASTKQSVTLKPHCLDRTEVTLGAYDACVKKGACTEPDTWGPKGNARWCNWKRTGDFGAHPINCLDHAQAAAFCAFAHGRLPDEAEWEWSARGYEKGSAFPWGDEIPNGRACWDGDEKDEKDDDDEGPAGTCKVGSFAKGANPLGVVDLAGDVWEWTQGRDVQPGKEVDRGGGWLNAVPKLLLAGNRNEVDEKGRWSSVGFRCAYDR